MTAASQIPFWIYEQALTRHYLGADGPEGTVPLEFIDASGRQIARAMGRPDEEGEDALKDFVRVVSRPRLIDDLRHGTAPTPPAGMNVMGCFNYLVLSCHIASVSPDVAHSDRYRDRLQVLLGLGKGVSELGGLAKLWKRAQQWCQYRCDRGEPFRPILLPDPGTMTQIGYALRISFPSRGDIKRMERLFDSRAIRKAPTVREVVAAVRSETTVRPWSQGFSRAFDDFSSRWLAGERLLEDHPFWIAVGELRRHDGEGRDDRIFELELRAGFDGEPSYSITSDAPEILRALSIEPDVERTQEVPSIDVTVTQMLALFDECPRSLPSGLRKCHSEGAIPFSETTWGIWHAQRAPTGASVRMLAREGIGRPRATGEERHRTWTLGPRMSCSDADAFLASLRGVPPERSGIAGARITGGIRMGEVYLGRPAFLPTIGVVVGCDASIVPVGATDGTVAADVEGDVVALSCTAPVDGVWRLSVRERGIVRAQPSFVFEPEARERAAVPIDDLSPGWRPEEPDPIGGVSTEVQLVPGEVAPHTTSTVLLDLLEALYASGGRGWSEQDVVQTIKTCLPDRFAGWDVLRLLVDSGWLEARVCNRWKARRWYLVPPRLVVYRSGEVLLEGAAPAALRRRFRDIASAMGAPSRSRAAPSDWSVPSSLADVRDPKAFADALGVPSTDTVTTVPSHDLPIEFEPTLYNDERRFVSWTWDWGWKRFVSRGVIRHPDVTLEQLSTIRPCAADIYRIVRSGRVERLLDGRNAAILVAHRLAGVPLFRFDASAGVIERVSGEGALPTTIARYLRLRNGCGPGLDFADDGGRRFVALCQPSDAVLLKGLLGDALDGVTTAASRPDELLRTIALGRSRGLARCRPLPGRWIGAARC